MNNGTSANVDRHDDADHEEAEDHLAASKSEDCRGRRPPIIPSTTIRRLDTERDDQAVEYVERGSGASSPRRGCGVLEREEPSEGNANGLPASKLTCGPQAGHQHPKQRVNLDQHDQRPLAAVTE